MMCSVSSPSPSESLNWSSPIPFTWALIALLFLVHMGTGMWEWWRGYESVFDALVMDRSVRMRVAVGGQLDLSVNQGEVWRLVTSTLLHGDLLHLIVNCVAIAALGRLLEPLYGGVRMWACFSVGAVLASCGSHLVGVIQSDGSSGGAFALLAMASVLGFRWRHRLDAEDRRILGPILWGFVVLNLVLSIALPFVDGVGHLVGFAVGIVLGWLPVRSRLGWQSGVSWLWLVGYFLVNLFGCWWVLQGMTARQWALWWTG